MLCNNTCMRYKTIGIMCSNVLLLLLLLLLLCLVTSFLSSLVLLLLSQWWTPPLRFQVSACSTFLMMCDVPSMAVFCRESTECCPGIVSRYFRKLLLTIPVAPVISGMTNISCFIFSEFLYLDFYTLISFQLPFVLHLLSSSSSFPVLGLMRPVTGVTKLNPSFFSKVCLNFFPFWLIF
jgi:hypothetical protein